MHGQVAAPLKKMPRANSHLHLAAETQAVCDRVVQLKVLTIGIAELALIALMKTQKFGSGHQLLWALPVIAATLGYAYTLFPGVPSSAPSVVDILSAQRKNLAERFSAPVLSAQLKKLTERFSAPLATDATSVGLGGTLGVAAGVSSIAAGYLYVRESKKQSSIDDEVTSASGKTQKILLSIKDLPKLIRLWLNEPVFSSNPP